MGWIQHLQSVLPNMCGAFSSTPLPVNIPSFLHQKLRQAASSSASSVPGFPAEATARSDFRGEVSRQPHRMLSSVHTREDLFQAQRSSGLETTSLDWQKGPTRYKETPNLCSKGRVYAFLKCLKLFFFLLKMGVKKCLVLFRRKSTCTGAWRVNLGSF